MLKGIDSKLAIKYVNDFFRIRFLIGLKILNPNWFKNPVANPV